MPFDYFRFRNFEDTHFHFPLNVFLCHIPFTGRIHFSINVVSLRSDRKNLSFVIILHAHLNRSSASVCVLCFWTMLMKTFKITFARELVTHFSERILRFYYDITLNFDLSSHASSHVRDYEEMKKIKMMKKDNSSTTARRQWLFSVTPKYFGTRVSCHPIHAGDIRQRVWNENIVDKFTSTSMCSENIYWSDWDLIFFCRARCDCDKQQTT